MQLTQYIAKPRIVDLKSTEFAGALAELVETCTFSPKEQITKQSLLAALMEREGTMTTYLGDGILLPHVRLPIKRPYMLAFGRVAEGLTYQGAEEYEKVRLVCLLVASDKEPRYLKVLAALARVFQNKENLALLTASSPLEQFQENIKTVFSKSSSGTERLPGGFNQLMMTQAQKIAKGANCSSIMLFTNAFEESSYIKPNFKDFKTIIVSEHADQTAYELKADATIAVQAYSKRRLSQMRSAILIGLSRGILLFNEKVCCIAGLPKTNQLDTVVVADIKQEFQSALNYKRGDLLPKRIQPEVFERVLAIATELAVEGREGKPVGALFVVGAVEELKPYTKPLVLNPFYGYKDEDRNILNPFMDETVKEYSTIDGAFVVRADGVLESAGTLIYIPNVICELPGGLGSRHVAAATISEVADCISIAVSASTRQVTLFRNGKMIPLI